MKKALIFLLTLIMVLPVFSGCNSEKENKSGDGRLKIVASVFPAYDFARQVCGDNAEVSLLIPPGTEAHTYEPSAKDIAELSESDLFIYVGGESDEWLNEIISSLGEGLKTLKMLDYVTLYTEETVEGMQTEDEEEAEYDEHIWTSPKNAVLLTKAICEAVSEIDSENSGFYESSCEKYTTELEKLDCDFAEFFSECESKTLIFGDRFPLRYFTEEYGLEYYAAFPGCASETEPSAATVAFLIDKVKEEDIKTVFYIEFSNHRIADIIAEETGAETTLFHTCHNVSQEELDRGATYVSIMRENLGRLREAMQ